MQDYPRLTQHEKDSRARRLTGALIIIGATLCLVAVIRIATAAPPVAWTTHATLKRVLDGDTVEVEVRRRMKIRLKDCWAPELKNRGGSESKEYLLSLVQPGDNVIVMINASERDLVGDILTFDRFVGSVWLPNEKKSLNEQQVAAGHATREQTEP